MGCVFTSPTKKPNVFKVINLNEDGTDYLPGKIEITDDFILLHQKRKHSISWPIRTLRRYGYETNIFSFEAGRRCPTGEGIFAFRCEQAEFLFQLLQANIQRSCGTNSSSTRRDQDGGNNYLEPRAVGVRHFRLESIGSTSSCPITPVSPVPPPSITSIDSGKNESESTNTNNDTSVASAVAIASPKPDDNIFDINNKSGNGPVYMNVAMKCDDGSNNEDSLSQHGYTNVVTTPTVCSLVFPSEQDEKEFNLGVTSPSELQYVVLELDDKPVASSSIVNNGKSATVQDTNLSPGYTTIDFKRTWALLQTAKMNVENDIGCKRRTRHNSNAFDTFR